MIYTTLKQLRAAGACIEGYNKLVRSMQGKEFSRADENRDSYIRFGYKQPINLLYVLESNGLDDALWALRASNATDRDCRMFAVTCARSVQHLMTDQRSIDALDVAERFANGDASPEERAAAWDVARDAAWDAAWAAAWAAARDAARDAQKQLLIDMCNGEAPWQKGV